MEIVTIITNRYSAILRDDTIGFVLRWTIEGLMVERCSPNSMLVYNEQDLYALTPGEIIPWQTVLRGGEQSEFRIRAQALDSSLITCIKESRIDKILNFLISLDTDEQWLFILEQLYIENPTLDLVDYICKMDNLKDKTIWNQRRLTLLAQSMINIKPEDNKDLVSQNVTAFKMHYLKR